MTTYVHVNKNTIASNRKHGRSDPAVRVQKGKYGKPRYAFRVKICGECTVMYSPHKPILPCGARMVIATEARVKVIK